MSRDSRPPEPSEHSPGVANQPEHRSSSEGTSPTWKERAGGEELSAPEFDEDALFELWRREEEEADDEDDEELSLSAPPGAKQLLTLTILAVAALALLYKTYQPVGDYLRWRAQEVRACGDPMQWIDDPASIPELESGDRCVLQGTISNLNIYLLGAPDEPNALRPLDRLKGLSYLSRLTGTYRGHKLFALHPAANDWLERYKLRKQTLFGAELSLEGTLVEPDQPGPYQPLARDIRDRFRLTPEQPILLLDATDRFTRYQWAFLSFALSCLILLVVSIRLILTLRAIKRAS